MRLDVPRGDEIARALLQPKREINQLLATAGRLDSGTAFERVLSAVKEQVRQHLGAEEHDLLPLLRKLEAAERRWDLGDRYLRAVPLPRRSRTRTRTRRSRGRGWR